MRSQRPNTNPLQKTGINKCSHPIRMLVSRPEPEYAERFFEANRAATCLPSAFGIVPDSAKLCRAAGGELEQIQLLLGHASVQTTERYLGPKQDLVHAPNDGIKLRVAV
jgi:hypothetical protein